jgi:hypothetical protein
MSVVYISGLLSSEIIAGIPQALFEFADLRDVVSPLTMMIYQS